jgi:NAD(P)H-hydrate epimerase
MAGATVLAARAALRSGIGMVKVVVAPESLSAVQEAEPHALAAPWPETDADIDSAIANWADAIVVGPGLGNTSGRRQLIENILRRFRGPVLADADALNVFANDAPALGTLFAGRPALVTPHPAELGRLIGKSVDEILAQRFEIGARVADTLGAAVLLKGVPTVVSGPTADGRTFVSASGTPVLATAGSGDLLSGIAGTLLAQTGDPVIAGAVGAWVHGHAAELVSSPARGASLADVEDALKKAWRFSDDPLRYPVLHELGAVGFEPRLA